MKKNLRLIFISSFMAAFLIAGILAYFNGAFLECARPAGFAPPSRLSSYSGISPFDIKNDFFTSPAGIFTVGPAGAQKKYAADKNLGILVYGADGNIEKTFKRAGAKYAGVCVTGNIIITTENGRLAFFNADGNESGSDAAASGFSDPENFLPLNIDCFTLSPSGAVIAAENGRIHEITLGGAFPALTLNKAAGSPFNTGLTGINSVASAGSGLLLSADHGFEKAVYSYDFISALRVKSFPRINGVAGYESGGAVYAAVAAGNAVTLIDTAAGAVVKEFLPASLPLTRGGIAAASSLHVSGSDLYVCDADSCAVIILSLPDMSFKELLFASSGSETGYLNRPRGACEWDGSLYIADSGNRRVQVWLPDGSVDIFGGEGGLYNPAAVAVDPLGQAYVVDNGSRIHKFGAAPAYALLKSVTVPGADISGIAVSADGRIFIADHRNGEILAADEDLVFSHYYAVAKPVSISASVNFNALYILDAAGAVTRLDNVSGMVSAAALSMTDGGIPVSGLSAFAVDYKNNIIALRGDEPAGALEILKFEQAADSGNAYDLSGAAPLESPALTYEYAAYGITHMAYSVSTGALYMADAVKSRIYKAEAAVTGAEWLDPASFPDPVDYASGAALKEYATVSASTSLRLYSMPAVSKSPVTVARGEGMVLLTRDLCDNSYYSFVYLPSLNKAGYVMKPLISGANAPEDPPFTDGRVFTDNTPVYKFPSRLSPKIKGADGEELRLQKDGRAKLLPYSKAADHGPEKWYCIASDAFDGIGFVNVLNVANYKYQPTTGKLRTDGDIVKSAPDGAFMFEKDGDTYKPMDVPPLSDGARVQVVGSFRSNSQYTEVIYQDPDLGLIQGFILTKYIKYDTTTNYQLIMLVLLLVLAVVSAIAVYLFKRRKRRTLR